MDGCLPPVTCCRTFYRLTRGTWWAVKLQQNLGFCLLCDPLMTASASSSEDKGKEVKWSFLAFLRWSRTAYLTVRTTWKTGNRLCSCWWWFCWNDTLYVSIPEWLNGNLKPCLVIICNPGVHVFSFLWCIQKFGMRRWLLFLSKFGIMNWMLSLHHDRFGFRLGEL